ncbi:MAG: type II secretion system protein GspL [Deltaproteobacteria bacterium]|nr:type II secretion system protein GspL [Deltaproteobacteria bacterium]
MYRRVLGLDIGSYSVKAVLSRGGLGRLEVRRFMQMPRDAASDESAAETIRRAITKYRQNEDLAGADLICAFPGQMASFRRLHLPFGDLKKIRQAVPFEVESQVPYEIEDLVLDYQVIERSAAGADVLVGLVQRDALGDLLATLESGGVDPRVLELDATALANVAPFIEGGEGYIFLVDLGHEKTCLSGLRDRKLHSVRTIPIGGKALTAALAQDLGAELAEAERRKHEEGLSLLGRSTPVFARTLDRLAQEIDRTLAAPENTKLGRPDKLILCGGTSRARGMAEFLQDRVGIPCAPMALRNDERLIWRVSADEVPILPQALGLSLRGSLAAPVSELNLRREEFVYRRDFDVVRRKFMPSLVIATALLLLLIGSVVVKTMKNRAISAEIDARIEQVFRETNPNVTRIVDPLAQMRLSLAEMKRRTETLGLYAGNVTALDVLREISSRVPPGLDVTLSMLSIDEDRIRLQGITQSFELAERVKSELEKIPFFKEVNVGQVQADRGGGKSFDVTITMGSREVRPEAPPPAAAPAADGGEGT